MAIINALREVLATATTPAEPAPVTPQPQSDPHAVAAAARGLSTETYKNAYDMKSMG